MLTLCQLINRMIYLEYNRIEVEEHLNALASGKLTTDELFDILGVEVSHPAMIQRLTEVLPKRESAITICFLRAQD